MQIKLKVIPDEGATEVHEFKDYGEVLEFIINLPAPEEDHEHTMEIEGGGTFLEDGTIEEEPVKIKVTCTCGEQDACPDCPESPKKRYFFSKYFNR